MIVQAKQGRTCVAQYIESPSWHTIRHVVHCGWSNAAGCRGDAQQANLYRITGSLDRPLCQPRKNQGKFICRRTQSLTVLFESTNQPLTRGVLEAHLLCPCRHVTPAREVRELHVQCLFYLFNLCSIDFCLNFDTNPN